jgi:hypothetical protein
MNYASEYKGSKWTHHLPYGWKKWMSGNPNYLNPYPLKRLIWISVFISISNMDTKWMYLNSFFSSLSGSRSVFDKNMEYLIFICIHKEQGIVNLFKSFLYMTSDCCLPFLFKFLHSTHHFIKYYSL